MPVVTACVRKDGLLEGGQDLVCSLLGLGAVLVRRRR